MAKAKRYTIRGFGALPKKSRTRSVAGPHFKVTYDVVTPESAEEGGFAESGWEDEEGISVKPDQYDREEGLTAVDLAVKLLKKEGATEPSSGGYHKGVWYSTYGDTDYRTGASTTRSFHAYGFTEAQEREIYNAMTRRR